MTESFEDAIKALRHIARGNGSVMRIADRIVTAHERETKVEGVCGPITGGLRAAMHPWGWVESDGSITFVTSPTPPSIDAEQSLAISGSDFERCCDAIDSIHATLERENEDLRMKFVNADRHAQFVERENAALKAELDRVLGEGVPMTDENMADEGLVRLPVDADGEPICVGDEMVADDGVAFLVECVSLYAWGWRVTGDGHDADGNSCTAHTYPELCHHQPDTWERILADALGCDPYEVEGDDDLMAIVARCKALCERTKGDA